MRQRSAAARSILRLTIMRLAAAGMILSASPVKAQILYGTIVGNVKDSQGAVIPGATVTATNTETNLTRETVTNEEGAYSLTNVLPGPYDVKITMTGFREAIQVCQPHDESVRDRLFRSGELRRLDTDLPRRAHLFVLDERLEGYGPTRLSWRLLDELPISRPLAARIGQPARLFLVQPVRRVYSTRPELGNHRPSWWHADGELLQPFRSLSPRSAGDSQQERAI